MREIDFHKQAHSSLLKLEKADKNILFQIIEKIEQLKKNPNPSYSKKLVGYKDYFRIRLGKYRVVYKYDEKIVYILLIENRDNVYKLLRKLLN